MIKNVKVDWMDEWGNDPRFIVELDCKMPEWPGEDDPVWTRYEPGYHVAVVGDIVFYFYTNGKPTDGYGGRPFIGTFANGGGFSYRGAWSSRAACINGIKPEDSAPFVVDVVIGHCATSIDAQKLLDWYLENRYTCDFRLAMVDNGDQGEILLPARMDGSLKNTDRVKKYVLI
jgi:hypothetical protein